MEYKIVEYGCNQAAISLYEKNGFRVDKSKKMSLMRFLGAGYPITLRKK